MLAKDVMTREVTTVTPETGVAEIARTLLKRHISAVPVLDGKGKLCGIVSEGDLMRRVESGTERRRSWWLELLSENRDLAHDYVKSHGQAAKDVMTHDVVTIGEDTGLAEIAGLLERKHIKRVPVMRGGKLVGIVSRANLLQALAAAGPRKAPVAPDDRVLREAVLKSFKSQPWTPDLTVNVTVEKGEVSLYGLVASDDERQALRVAAEEIAGVGKVRDHLSVNTALRAAI